MPMVSEIFAKLKEPGCWVIFDESQTLLATLPSDYRPLKWDKRDITRKKLNHSRSFCSFATGFVMKQGLKSLWCGTKLRIANIEGLSAAAGLKPPEYHIHGLQLSDGIANFQTLWHDTLYELQDIKKAYDTYRILMTTSYDSSLGASSPYYFWKQRVGAVEKPSEKRKNGRTLQTQTVASTLLDLCISSLFGDGQGICFPPALDLLATNLVMVSVRSGIWEAKMAEPIV
ncbi:hypothetical protein HDU81_006298 [Chytriomyces hyalinus]|nr:hypothetical protein HDU81_006298 [Chytriomyces hyalinus]